MFCVEWSLHRISRIWSSSIEAWCLWWRLAWRWGFMVPCWADRCCAPLPSMSTAYRHTSSKQIPQIRQILYKPILYKNWLFCFSNTFTQFARWQDSEQFYAPGRSTFVLVSYIFRLFWLFGDNVCWILAFGGGNKADIQGRDQIFKA